MKVLFVTERWCDGLPHRGISNTQHNLFGSLETSGLAEYECLFMDQHFLDYGRTLDGFLINYCSIYKPDVLVFSPLIDMYIIHPTTIKPETLASINVPKVVFWWDSCYRRRMDFADSFAPHADLSVIVDRNDYITNYPYKFTHLWVPQDTSIFHNPGLDRDLDVVFMGRLGDHSRRTSYINALKSSGVNVFCGGGQRESETAIEEYARCLQRAKIVLNFSWTVDSVESVTKHQLKCRSFETALCGALLMESENPYTKQWIEDCVHFHSEKDLCEKVKFYLNNEDRLRIAHSACEKATKSYNAKEFWKSLFTKVGYDFKK